MKISAIYIAVIAAILSVSTSFAQSSTPDTLINIEEKSKVAITENRHGVTIKVSGKVSGKENGDPFMSAVTTNFGSDSRVNTRQNTFSNKVGRIFAKNDASSSSFSFNTDQLFKSGSWSLFLSGVCLGLTNPVNQGQPGGLQWSKSIEICWMNAFGIRYKFSPDFSFSFGLGFDWRNYKTTLCDRFLNVTEQGNLEWEFPGNKEIRMSRLKTFAVQFPLLINTRFKHSRTNLKFGPILNVNTYSSVKTMYFDENGNKRTDFKKGINVRKTTFDLFGAISYDDWFGIYVRYSPLKILNDGNINFSPLTLGFTIGI